MAKFVKVPIDTYIALLDGNNELQCLEHGGVDNWDWYDESLENKTEFHESDITLEIIEE